MYVVQQREKIYRECESKYKSDPNFISPIWTIYTTGQDGESRPNYCFIQCIECRNEQNRSFYHIGFTVTYSWLLRSNDADRKTKDGEGHPIIREHPCPHQIKKEIAQK